MRFLIAVLFVLLLSGLKLNAHEKSATSWPTYVQSLIDGYYGLKVLGLPRPLPDPPDEAPPGQDPPRHPQPPRSPPSQCPAPPSKPSDCIETVCNRLGHFACDDRGELQEVARQCRNVRGACVRAVCSRIPYYECNDRQELFEITEACRGVADVGCIDYVCSRLPYYQCDDRRELLEIASQCR